MLNVDLDRSMSDGTSSFELPSTLDMPEFISIIRSIVDGRRGGGVGVGCGNGLLLSLPRSDFHTSWIVR